MYYTEFNGTTTRIDEINDAIFSLQREKAKLKSSEHKMLIIDNEDDIKFLGPEITMANFVYVRKQDKVIKNRWGGTGKFEAPF